MFEAISKAIVAILALISFLLPAKAMSESVKVQMDQPFRVASALMPAGQYTIRLLNNGSDSPVLVFEAGPSSRVFVAVTRTANPMDTTDANTELVLSSSEDGLTVREVRIAGQSARYQLIGSR